MIVIYSEAVNTPKYTNVVGKKVVYSLKYHFGLVDAPLVSKFDVQINTAHGYIV